MKDGIHAIIRKIQTDAEEHGGEYYERRKNIIDEEINNEKSVYLYESDKRREMLKKNNGHEYNRMTERTISRLNREILSYQHDLINEIFDMAVSKLREVSKKESSDMFRAAVRGLNGRFILYLGEYSKDKIDITEIGKAAKENHGLDIVLSAETIPDKSGFVLRDNRVEYNCLYEDLIEDMKNERAALILKEVFGDSDTRLII